MKYISARGAVILNTVAILLILVTVGLFLRPYYEHYMLQKAFSSVMKAGDNLYNAAQTYHIGKGAWPTSASDLRDHLGDAKLVSDWVVGDKIYSCELAYGRGDRTTNNIVCSARGKYSKVLQYQIPLSDKKLNQRYCWALKTNKNANHICKEAGGIFSHAVGGQAVPYRVYRIE